MYAEMKQLVESIWLAIKTGKSDGQKMADLAVKCIRSGTLYPVLRDASGKIQLDENGEVVKGQFEFGEQIVVALTDIFLALDASHAVETEGTKFGEMKRVFISASRYASERLGMEYAPKAVETSKFRLDATASAEDIVSILRKKLDSEKLRSITSLLT